MLRVLRGLGLVLALVAAPACKQGVNESCQYQGDCEDGLICEKPPGGPLDHGRCVRQRLPGPRDAGPEGAAEDGATERGEVGGHDDGDDGAGGDGAGANDAAAASG